MLVYTVSVRFPNEGLRDEFVAWLEDGHLADVVAAGAESGEVIVPDGDQLVVDAVYRFSSREAFAAYVEGPAVALRASGSSTFADRGAVFTRSTGLSRYQYP